MNLGRRNENFVEILNYFILYTFTAMFTGNLLYLNITTKLKNKYKNQQIKLINKFLVIKIFIFEILTFIDIKY